MVNLTFNTSAALRTVRIDHGTHLQEAEKTVSRKGTDYVISKIHVFDLMNLSFCCILDLQTNVSFHKGL